MKAPDLFEKILRDNGFSLTKARSAIFRCLLDAKHPQSMAEVIAATREGADRVSVYRAIALFEKLGIVQRINIGWKYKIELSEAFLDHHHHMTCLGCGRVVPVKDDAAFESMIERLGRQNGFSLTAHQLEMQGYCPNCPGAK